MSICHNKEVMYWILDSTNIHRLSAIKALAYVSESMTKTMWSWNAYSPSINHLFLLINITLCENSFTLFNHKLLCNRLVHTWVNIIKHNFISAKHTHGIDIRQMPKCKIFPNSFQQSWRTRTIKGVINRRLFTRTIKCVMNRRYFTQT